MIPYSSVASTEDILDHLIEDFPNVPDEEKAGFESAPALQECATDSPDVLFSDTVTVSLVTPPGLSPATCGALDGIPEASVDELYVPVTNSHSRL